MQLPTTLREMWKREPEWLDELPRVVRGLADEWDLALEEPIDTPHSLVVPAGDVVLKVNAPSHFEADHEADLAVPVDRDQRIADCADPGSSKVQDQELDPVR